MESRLHYSIFDRPPIPLAIFQGLQHSLLMIGATFAVPIIITGNMCMEQDAKERAEITSTVLFMSGIITLIQCTVGVRLPVLQGATFSLLVPAVALLQLDKWQCPLNEVEGANITNTSRQVDLSEFWKPQILEIQGGIISASIVQVVIGLTGVMGVLMRFIGPLTIAPTITLIGLALFGVAADYSAANWGIAALTMVLLALFSQYLKNLSIPCCHFSTKEKQCVKTDFHILQLFPILITIIITWILCYILTIYDVFGPDPPDAAFTTRTDAKLDAISRSSWFRFPYPGQWGVPTFSSVGFLGMLTGVIAGIIESVGDYHACARMAGAPPPPKHAINRGIMIEGIGGLLAGLWGTGSGTTTYSENISAISLTGVGSRLVLQMAGVILIIIGCFPKLGALFITIPDPIIGGLLMVTFGIILAVGISNLQFTDLNSPRNHFVLGVSIMLAFSVPQWLNRNPGAIDTGSDIADQMLTVLLTTSMFIAGLVALILDNTIPGTLEERGIKSWTEQIAGVSDPTSTETNKLQKCYDIPLISSFLYKYKIFRYLPISPSFDFPAVDCRSKESSSNVETPKEHPPNDITQEMEISAL